MKKNTIYIVLLLLVSVLFFNCEDDKPADNKKVVMLAHGATYDDLSFLQSCKSGLELAKEDFNLEVIYDIDDATDNYQQRIDKYCDEGYDLIIAIGYMWNDVVINSASGFPDSKFVIVDTELSEVKSNAMSVLFDVNEASFPLGYLAAWWAENNSTSPAVGYVAAMDIPQIRQFVEPFVNGIDLFNQTYSQQVNSYGDYAGVFFDSELGKHLSDSIILLGADVIFGVGSEVGNGALLKAKEHGKLGIGVDVDQYISFPEVSDILLSSALKGLDKSVYAVVQAFTEESFDGGGIYIGNLANEGVGIAPYHDFDSQIPDSIKSDIDLIISGIIAGTTSTGWTN